MDTATRVQILDDTDCISHKTNTFGKGIWTRRYEFNSWTRLIAFHIALIPLGMVWIQLFSLQLWINSTFFSLGEATSLGEGKLWMALLLSLDCSTLPLIRALYCWVLSKEASSTIFKVFGMTRPGIEPRSPGPLADTLPTRPMSHKKHVFTVQKSVTKETEVDP